MGHKFHACSCEEDGFKFPSKLERDTYSQLKRLHDKGVITNLFLQHTFQLKSNSGKVIGKYVADFVCVLPSGEKIVIESKGVATAVWRRTRKHFIADFPEYRLIEVRDHSQFPLEF
ncbi:MULTISPECIES: DUF1064 domain-containing protein [Cyanophyceae]|uniref:DUF1064 domain-containing protein n=1 Tax=Cyanophyceae TaxID=3028117 RepID=UPI00168471F4|nr:DUF1064 domain-containing protein [Trichocoleus sp. FACHB-40]MBD2006342.1 DUF1064 domain-containing protein [Trichocoleus sp. FACHB-40]